MTGSHGFGKCSVRTAVRTVAPLKPEKGGMAGCERPLSVGETPCLRALLVTNCHEGTRQV